LLAHEFGNALAHENTATDVADHRVAAIAGGRIGALDGYDRVENGCADICRAHIAREHTVAFAQHASRLDPFHHLADQAGVEDMTLPAAVAGVIGELHGMDRPDLDTQPLQRKRRGCIADMAERHVRLDGKDIHDRRLIPQFVGRRLPRVAKTSWPGIPAMTHRERDVVRTEPTSSPSFCWPRRHRCSYKSSTGRCSLWPHLARTG